MTAARRSEGSLACIAPTRSGHRQLHARGPRLQRYCAGSPLQAPSGHGVVAKHPVGGSANRSAALTRSPIRWRLPSGLDRELNAKGADLLHLHWLQDEFLSVEAIGRLRGPVVWTLHDTWPFCGSEHYPLDAQDQRFALGYSRGSRSRLDRGLDLDRWTWLRKGKAWRSLLPRLQLIAPSRWMAEQASRSALLHGCR